MIYLYYTKMFMGYNFGPEHPMQPGRLMLTHRLMEELGLLYRHDVEVLEPWYASEKDLMTVHRQDYIEAVKAEVANYAFGLGTDDTPVFPGIYDAARIMAGGSIEAAERLLHEDCGAFNIAGGLHHAFPAKAAGFCVFNDPALAIAVLKRKFQRILYIDIDAHHADGVQAIFYDDPSVLTISIHESGKYIFPGTGFIEEIGCGPGRGYSANIPLPQRSPDRAFLDAFDEIVPALFRWFRPEIVVAQLGADAHYADPLTSLNLTLDGYVGLVQRIANLSREHCNGRILALGGGGYNLEVVPLAWANAFQILLGDEVQGDLPAWWVEFIEGRTGRPPLTLPDRGLGKGDYSKVAEELEGTIFGLQSILSGIHGSIF